MGNGFKKPVPAAQIKDQRLAEKVAAENRLNLRAIWKPI